MTLTADPSPETTNEPTAPSKKRRMRILPLALVALVLAAGGFAWWRWVETYHLKTVREGVLYRDGHQSPREFVNAIGRVKPKTVVCLVDENEVKDPAKPQFQEEVRLLAEKGIKLEHIPVKLGGYPTTDDVRRFLGVVERKENQPVLVHCAQGVRRTGMMVAAYQMSLDADRLDKEKAKAAIETFGHSERTTRDVKKFIDVYDPATREVTQTLKPTGDE